MGQFNDKVLYAGLVVNYIRHYVLVSLRRLISSKIAALSSSDEPPRSRNIVVVGAAFAGYHAVKQLATLLPPNSPFRIVVIEPNSHFNFTWVLPRFCTVEGHEHKAFIPYGPNLAAAPADAVHWIRDRVVSIGPETVRLRDGAEEIPYAFLVIATGSTVPDGLPSRVGAEDKAEGMERLRGFQRRIKAASRIVVAGGGASGVELATDAKSAYPDKHVVLVHSRTAVMNRFGSDLQAAATEGLKRLGVEVILGEKVVSHGGHQGPVVLTSGRTLESDCFINCTGQLPASDIVRDLAPGAVAASGHIDIKPTLQIAADHLPNVYVCGDVANTHITNPNSRAAMRQAETVADNILRAVRGKTPRHTYEPKWGDAVIKLTLGLDRSSLHFFDGKKKQLTIASEEKDLALMCDGAWTSLGAKPFEDPPKEATEHESTVEKAAKVTAAAEPGV